MAPTVDPTAWANRLAEAKARAAQLKAARASGYSSNEITEMYSRPSSSNNNNAQVSESSASQSYNRSSEQEFRPSQNTSSSSHPGYRGIMFPGGQDRGGEPEYDSGRPVSHRASERDLYQSPTAAPSRVSQEADDMFYANLRGGDGGREKSAASGRRPAWNSDFGGDDMRNPSEPAPREDHNAARAAGPMSTKQRLAQMRDDLSAPPADAQAAKNYAGIVPNREPNNNNQPSSDFPASRAAQRSYDSNAMDTPAASSSGSGGLGDLLQPKKPLSRTGLKPAVRPKPSQSSSGYSATTDNYSSQSNSFAGAQYSNPYDDIPVGAARSSVQSLPNDLESHRGRAGTNDISPPHSKRQSARYSQDDHHQQHHQHQQHYSEGRESSEWRESPSHSSQDRWNEAPSRRFDTSPPLPAHKTSANRSGPSSYDQQQHSAYYQDEDRDAGYSRYRDDPPNYRESHSAQYSHSSYPNHHHHNGSSNGNDPYSNGRVHTAPPSHTRHPSGAASSGGGAGGAPSGSQLALLKSKLRDHSAATAAGSEQGGGRRTLTRQPSFGNLVRGTSVGAYRDSGSGSARNGGGSGSRPGTGGPYSNASSYPDDPYIEESNSNTPPFRHSSASYGTQRPGMLTHAGSSSGSSQDPRVRSAGSTGYSSYSDLKRPASESHSATSGPGRSRNHAYQYNIDEGYDDGSRDAYDSRRDQDDADDQDTDERGNRLSYFAADPKNMPDNVAKQWENAYPPGYKPPAPEQEEENIWRRKNPVPSSRSRPFASQSNRANSAPRAPSMREDRSYQDEDDFMTAPPSRAPQRSAPSSAFAKPQANSRRSQSEPQEAFVGPDGEVVEIERVECRQCGRKFAPKALDAHSRACNKVFISKRKAFDTKAHMIPAEAQALAAKKAMEEGMGSRFGGRSAVDRPIKSKANKGKAWENKSNQLREAMRAARQIKAAVARGEDISKLPPPPPSAPDSSLVPCPHCGRNFSEQAAERHIPKCTSIKAKPKALVRGSGVAAGAAGAKKLAATQSTSGASTSTRAVSSAGLRSSHSASGAAASGSGYGLGREDPFDRGGGGGAFSSGILPVPGMPGHSETRSQMVSRARVSSSGGYGSARERKMSLGGPGGGGGGGGGYSNGLDDVPIRGAHQASKYGGGYGQNHSNRSGAADYERMIDQEYSRANSYSAGYSRR